MKKSEDSVAVVLAERGRRHGPFGSHSRIAQRLKRVMEECPNWLNLADDQKEALQMVQHKVARILNGDPDHTDSWLDIGGYARLVADRLKKDGAE